MKLELTETEVAALLDAIELVGDEAGGLPLALQLLADRLRGMDTLPLDTEPR